MRWYFCVNCGNHGDFGFDRQRSIKCEECGYEDLTAFDDEEEYNEQPAVQIKRGKDEESGSN